MHKLELKGARIRHVAALELALVRSKRRDRKLKANWARTMQALTSQAYESAFQARLIGMLADAIELEAVARASDNAYLLRRYRRV